MNENKKIHLLFIDDERILCEVAQEIFEDMGFDVSVFNDAQEALDVFMANPQRYHVVLTDQTMPKINGFELAKAILEVNPKIPILICTGYSNEVDKNIAMEAGVRDLVQKPLKYGDIAEQIKVMLQAEAG